MTRSDPAAKPRSALGAPWGAGARTRNVGAFVRARRAGWERLEALAAGIWVFLARRGREPGAAGERF